MPCRRQVAGPYAVANPRALHYVCSLGVCDHYEVCHDEDGEVNIVGEDIVELLARLRVI